MKRNGLRAVLMVLCLWVGPPALPLSMAAQAAQKTGKSAKQAKSTVQSKAAVRTDSRHAARSRLPVAVAKGKSAAIAKREKTSSGRPTATARSVKVAASSETVRQQRIAAQRGAASQRVQAARAASARGRAPTRAPGVIHTSRATTLATAAPAVGSAGLVTGMLASAGPVSATANTPMPATASAAASAAAPLPGPVHASPDSSSGHLSIGEAIGLHRVPDRLALRSAVALVVDPGTGEILYEKNSRAVLPIASITKLMTAMVVLDAKQPMSERITITEADRDTERSSASRLPIGSSLTRAELLQLALMSSENRAASALARSYPGGQSAFVAAANRKAEDIGMRDSVYRDGTGLSSSNVSTARDLVVMVAHAARYPLIRDYSTAADLTVRTAHGARVFRTTNRMVASSNWDLMLQKTGYISESGNCLVIQGNVDGRPLIMVLLDSQGRYSRVGDAMRIRRWIEG